MSEDFGKDIVAHGMDYGDTRKETLYGWLEVEIIWVDLALYTEVNIADNFSLHVFFIHLAECMKPHSDYLLL